MQELIAYLNERGFYPPNLQLNGKVIKCGRNGDDDDNCWVIGWQNESSRGTGVFQVAVFGDFATGEKFTYKPSGLSREDARYFKERVTEASRASDEAERLAQAEAKQVAAREWQRAEDVRECGYLDKKLIPELYGAKTYPTDEGRVLVIPIRDAEGVLWSLQYILPRETKNKRFLKGGKKKGGFHLIGGEPEMELFICEGFATGASLYEATGVPVACAFDSGNLKTVAVALHKKYPNAAITICGDDDKWKDPSKNVGREKAVEAAAACNGRTMFPVFTGEENGTPTDFNDMREREGVEAVRKLFAGAPPAETGFIPLGHDEGVGFFYSIQCKDIVKMSAYTPTQMMHLSPLQYWESMYSKEKGGIDWPAAQNAIIQLSRNVGPFDNSRIRGTGVWMDDGRVVINTGHSLIVDGQAMTLTGMRSWHVYIQTKNRMPPMHSDPLTVDECKILVDCCVGMRWAGGERDGCMLAGWLAIARIAGALPIRPHVWVTGSSGTGKSTCMEKIVAPALGGPKGRLYVQGGSTEAGVRQQVKSSSMPLLCDEFETTGQKSSERTEALVELLRQCWSSTQGAVVKGSASGAAVEYQMTSAALVSSIRVNLTNDADRSRFTILELMPHGSNDVEWKLREAAMDLITTETGERLFARSCRMVRTILKSFKILSKALAAVKGQRFGQQNGMILAGYWSLISDDPISDEMARTFAAEFKTERDEADENVSDERECLTRLMTQVLHLRDGMGTMVSRTIAEIACNDDLSGLRTPMKSYGIVVDARGIYLMPRHAELEKLFANTRWAASWAASLLRLPGATKGERQRFGGKTGQHRCLFLPAELYNK